MGNLIAIKLHTQPGDEVICDTRGHINQYEMASMTAIAGVLPRMIDAPDGILTWKLVEPAIRPKIYYVAQTALISLENTHNMAGGSVYPQAVADEICDNARSAGIRTHLDGARIFNAAVALDRPPARVADLTRKFDSVMFCLSKALGAPVGSMLVGAREFIDQARIWRKRLGGGMRQVGVLAAAGLVALEESPKILRRDHENARYLAEGLAQIPGITLDPKKVVTNIIIFDLKNTGRTAAELSAALKQRGILANATGPCLIRMVTHFDVDRPAIDAALAALRSLLRP
jgi:threonine aldolase